MPFATDLQPVPNAVVYMPLIGTDEPSWRPVLAEPIDGNTFRIARHQPYDREAEEWAFPPGSIVRCRNQKMTDGNYTAAFELAEPS